MTNHIDEIYQASVEEQQAGMNRTAALQVLGAPAVAGMTMSKFIEEVRSSQVWSGPGGIGEFSVSEFASEVKKRMAGSCPRTVLDERIVNELESHGGEWMTGREIAQRLKDVEGATAQAVSARLRVLVDGGKARKTGEGVSRRYASTKSAQGSQPVAPEGAKQRPAAKTASKAD